MRTLLAGILLGLVITIILVLALPRKWGHWRAILAALAGFTVALLVDLIFS